MSTCSFEGENSTGTDWAVVTGVEEGEGEDLIDVDVVGVFLGVGNGADRRLSWLCVGDCVGVCVDVCCDVRGDVCWCCRW